MKRYHIDHVYYGNGRKIGNFDLMQLGRMLGPDKYPFDKHFQYDYYELTFVNRGKSKIFADDVESTVEEGEFYISLPFETHNIIYEENTDTDIDFFAFRINDRSLSKAFDSAIAKVKASGNRVFSNKKVNNIVGDAIAELEKESDFSEKFLESAFYMITIYLIRTINRKAQTDLTVYSDNGTTICYQIMNYIDTNIFSLYELKELSKITNYNYSYLSSLFKKKTGKTILDYYYNKKLAVAKTLLEENRVSPTKISELLNYTSYYSFSRAFKKKYGISPRTYKIQNPEKISKKSTLDNSNVFLKS